MAFTLSLVSFSCTGPIIGSLLVDAASNGDYFGPAIGMLGFSTALAVPFALFAAFPGWMNSLPQSGGWLNTVKVSLGFIELAFALKFLSTADMAWQAGILKRELFLALWIGIFLLLTLYLLGASECPWTARPRSLCFPTDVCHILWFLHLVHAARPVGSASSFDQWFSSPAVLQRAAQSGGRFPVNWGRFGSTQGGRTDHCPHALNCFHDLEEGLAYARSVQKPVMLDFTGWGCVNCRKMEEQVWSDPSVLQRLREKVVLVSLYVDERVKLPVEEQYYSEVLKSQVKTIGNKWSAFQAENYQTNSQPYYVLIGHEDHPIERTHCLRPRYPEVRGLAR